VRNCVAATIEPVAGVAPTRLRLPVFVGAVGRGWSAHLQLDGDTIRNTIRNPIRNAMGETILIRSAVTGRASAPGQPRVAGGQMG
jgi:hypothetical protein